MRRRVLVGRGKRVHMDGQDKDGEVLSFQLADVSKREGAEGNREWVGMRIRNWRWSCWWLGTADS